MKNIWLICLSLLVFCTNVSAQSTMSLSMQNCIDYAMKNNITLKNAQLDVLIQELQVKETVTAALPRVNGKAEFDDYLSAPQSIIPNTMFNPLAPAGTTKLSFSPQYVPSASISASQLVYDGSVFIALKARKAIIELARQGNEVTKETVIYNIYKAYYSLVIAYRQFELIKSSLTYARSIEHDLKVIQQNGFAEKIDVERTSVQVNNLATDSIRIGSLLDVSEKLLKYQIGMDMNTPIILTDTALEDSKKESLALLEQEKNYEGNPTYKLFQLQLNVNQYNLERYKLAAYPTVSVFGNTGSSYAFVSSVFNNLFNKNYYSNTVLLGLQLTVPIYAGHLRKYQIAEAGLNIEKTKNNMENMRQTIDFQVASSKTNLRNVVLQIRNQKSNLDLADDVLELARKKYKAGVGSNLEVTQAQTDQLRAQTNYFGSMLDLVAARADLKKALGLFK